MASSSLQIEHVHIAKPIQNRLAKWFAACLVKIWRLFFCVVPSFAQVTHFNLNGVRCYSFNFAKLA